MLRNRSVLLRFSVWTAMATTLWLAAAAALAADISIVSPASEETVHDNSGNVTVEVAAQLNAGQRIRLLIDGAPAMPDSRDTTFRLQGVNRGEHTLEAVVLNDDEEVIANSGPVVFYMWQASRLNPAR